MSHLHNVKIGKMGFLSESLLGLVLLDLFLCQECKMAYITFPSIFPVSHNKPLRWFVLRANDWPEINEFGA